MSESKGVMHATFEKYKLDLNCILLQVAFAVACSCEYQNEIQSALWSHRSVNLFTAATYNAEGKEESFLIVTNSSDKAICIFMLKVVDEMTCKDERELIVYSDGPSSEFRNQFITRKLQYLLSQHLNLPVSWKYFATSHGKGIVDDLCGAAKARVREQVRNKGKGSIVVQSSVDFAIVVPKLLRNVKIIQIDEAEIQSTIYYHKIGSMEHCL